MNAVAAVFDVVFARCHHDSTHNEGKKKNKMKNYIGNK